MWKPVAERVGPRVEERPDPVELVVLSRPTSSRRTSERRDARPSAPSCRRLAPATKNIVNAVSVMTIVVPRSGSLKTSAITGSAMSRNGTVPDRKPPIALPLFAIQWAR